MATFSLHLGKVVEGFTKKKSGFVPAYCIQTDLALRVPLPLKKKIKTTGHLNEIHEAPQVVLHKHRFHTSL